MTTHTSSRKGRFRLAGTALTAVAAACGYVSQLEMLDARPSEPSNRPEALQVRSAQHQPTAGLVRALGGGWETT